MVPMDALKFITYADWSDPVNWIPVLIVIYVLIYTIGIFFGEE